MADDRVYRILVSYQPEDSVFLARAPELDIAVEADTRGEAVQKAEEAIEALVEQTAVEGEPLPGPVDLAAEGGELNIKLSPLVYRDLLNAAKGSGMNADELAEQLLVRAIGELVGGAKRPRKPKKVVEGEAKEGQEKAEGEEKAEGDQKNTRNKGRGRGKGRRDTNENNRGGRGRRREGYRPDMDDQANFLAYVREQEKGGRGRR